MQLAHHRLAAGASELVASGTCRPPLLRRVQHDDLDAALVDGATVGAVVDAVGVVPRPGRGRLVGADRPRERLGAASAREEDPLHITPSTGVAPS